MFDKSAYGDIELSENEKQAAIEEYIKAYEALREAKKNKHTRIYKV